jgi:hypothetical protein
MRLDCRLDVVKSMERPGRQDSGRRKQRLAHASSASAAKYRCCDRSKSLGGTRAVLPGLADQFAAAPAISVAAAATSWMADIT